MERALWGRATSLLILAVTLSAVCSGVTASAASARTCSVSVEWYGWAGKVRTDTCANWVEVTADCALNSADGNIVKHAGQWTRVKGWLTFATGCEDGNTFPYTYLLIHHYRGGWHQVAVAGPFTKTPKLIRSTFSEP